MDPGLRIGIGFDFHPFVEGRPLVLGGVKIPHPKGLKGHSDADAVLHALIDSLLGAAGLGDIGSHFPDTSPDFRGISSVLLTNEVVRLIEKECFYIVNVDVVVIAEEPRLTAYKEAMRSEIAKALSVDASRVGLKATTMEKKGPIGRGEGIAVQAVALLQKVITRD